MNGRRLILTVGTKLPIVMVGRQIILMTGDIFAPATLGRHWFHSNAPRLIARGRGGRTQPTAKGIGKLFLDGPWRRGAALVFGACKSSTEVYAANSAQVITC